MPVLEGLLVTLTMSTLLGVGTPDALDVETEAPKAWPEGLSFAAFVDAGYQVGWQAQGADAEAPPHRAFLVDDGATLSFLGLDFGYETERFAARADLRFGASADRLIIGAQAQELGLGFIKQAFVSYKPTAALRVDFGQWDTIYGAEVSESAKNLNYSRGALYFLMQPFYHTGLRVSLDATESTSVTFVASTDINDPFSFETAPDLGVQGSWHPSDDLSVNLGYYLTLAGAGSRDLAHFVDLVANAHLGRFTFVFNADLGSTDQLADDPASDAALYGGLSLAAGAELGAGFGAAVRGEALFDPDGLFYGASTLLYTLTGTVQYRPSVFEGALFRVEQRVESASRDIFDTAAGPRGTWYSTLFGLVVETSFGS